VHSRIPIVTPNEQRALRVRPRPVPEKAPRHEGAKERPQSIAPISGSVAGTLPFRLRSVRCIVHEEPDRQGAAIGLSALLVGCRSDPFCGRGPSCNRDASLARGW
jgi:hypothetical protein